MNYQQALAIIHNPEAHTRQIVSEAAAYVLGTINASLADINQATAVVAYRF